MTNYSHHILTIEFLHCANVYDVGMNNYQLAISNYPSVIGK